MSNQPILQITDGTITIDLLARQEGVILKEWTPVIPEPKDGGVFSDSPLSSGRRLVLRNYDNAIETFEIVVRAGSQDSVIEFVRKLRGLLTQAHEYWTSEWATRPVYIVAKGSCETGTRYAIVRDWRLQTDDNPYSTPFSGRSPAMVDMNLVLERGDWLSQRPGTGACVETSGQKAALGSVSVFTGSVTASTDDATIRHSVTSISTTSALLVAGDRRDYEFGVRFQNVVVPAGAYILAAYVSLHLPGATNDVPVSILMETSTNPATYSTYANFIGRALSSPVAVMFQNFAGRQNTPSLVDLVQAMVDTPGWASGQAMAFQVKGTQSGNAATLEAHAWDFTKDTDFSAGLYIMYADDNTSFGQEATCEPVVFVSNKENTANITHIKYWDDVSMTFRDITETGGEWKLMPELKVGDYVAFGAAEGPFCSLILDLLSVHASAELDWEYYSSAGGGSWTKFIPHDETAVGGQPFMLPGIGAISWKQENDWEVVGVDGIAAYWIRARVRVAEPGRAVVAHNRAPYTVVRPSVEIAASQVAGDLPAKARIMVYAHGVDDTAADATMLWASRAHCALRSRSRGTDFSPFLNAADEQHQPGVNCLGGNAVFEEDTYDGGIYGASPSKIFSVWSTPAQPAFTALVQWVIDSQYASQYKGTYNVFLRYAQSVATDAVFTVRLSYTSGGLSGSVQEVTGPIVLNADDVNFKSKHLVSIGTISFLEDAGPDDVLGDIVIELQARAAAAQTLIVYDLVLMPTDEWFGVYTAIGGRDDGLNEGFMVDIDGGISVPKTPTRAVLRDTENGMRVDSRWSIIQNGPPILQAGADQALFFLFDQYEAGQNHALSFHGSLHSIQVQAQGKYLSMRGRT